eukprot:scaffold16693_cov48-Tisochrysis_lutea.AAC.2
MRRAAWKQAGCSCTYLWKSSCLRARSSEQRLCKRINASPFKESFRLLACRNKADCTSGHWTRRLTTSDANQYRHELTRDRVVVDGTPSADIEAKEFSDDLCADVRRGIRAHQRADHTLVHVCTVERHVRNADERFHAAGALRLMEEDAIERL